jgi:uncharacterized protein YjbJ (UPF0337 family)
MSDRKDLATEGAEDEVEGTADVVKGRVRNVVGGATGDSSEQLKGKAKELAGKAKQAVGKAKQKLDPEPGVDDAGGGHGRVSARSLARRSTVCRARSFRNSGGLRGRPAFELRHQVLAGAAGLVVVVMIHEHERLTA